MAEAIKPMKLGIIGCGNISGAYFSGVKFFDCIEIKACADLNMDAAKKVAEEFGVQAMTVEELLADPEIELVVNLTIPAAHAPVCMQVLEAGKHVHVEKPLAVDLDEAKKVIELAEAKGLRVGCAPDTFLGAGLQTCRKMIDDGYIGKPLAGTAFMLGRGPEPWHPNPGFFYQKGGGPMLDLGPYYVSALVHLLGPATRVTAVTTKGYDVRIAGHESIRGQELPVDVPTHYSGMIEFASGAVITMVMSFDVKGHNISSPIELYGTDGSLKVPDPNCFGGPVMLTRPESGFNEWKECALTHNYAENSRIIGAADMATAIRTGRPHRCSGEFAYHVLEVMEAFQMAHEAGGRYELKSTCAQPAPFPTGMLEGLLDR
jgi:predicted dehydrogenase